MKTIELFSGTKSFSKVMETHGHETFTVDNDPSLEPDLVVNLDVTPYRELAVPYFSADMLWASPPCTTFSVASISHYWTEGRPKNEKALEGIRILGSAIKIIAISNPRWWFLENPRGMMRKVIDEVFQKHGVSYYKRHTVSYCQYGSKIMKPTDIWTNASWWSPRMICKPGAACHERADRGSKTGVQGIYSLDWERARGNSATARGVIPPALFEEILEQMP